MYYIYIFTQIDQDILTQDFISHTRDLSGCRKITNGLNDFVHLKLTFQIHLCLCTVILNL